MFKRSLIVSLLLLFVFCSLAAAAPKKAVKRAAKKAPVFTKKEAPAETAKAEEDKVADLKEETNKALTGLRNDLEKVKADNSDAKIGAQIFFRWQKYSQGGTASTPNNFDIGRAYIDIKKKLDWDASARMTLDVARITGAARQNLFDYLKYAYVDLPVNIPAQLQVIPFSLTAKAGLQHTIWIDWADKQLGLRFIAKSLLDNEEVMSSADFGLGATGKFTIGPAPETEYHATLLNGTGYATNESNSKKALSCRLNSTIFDGGDVYGKVILGLFGNIEEVSSGLAYNGSAKQGGLAVSYQHEIGRVFAEYLTGSKSSKKVGGTSLGGVLNLGTLIGALPGFSAFCRVDQYDPDTNVANNDKNKSFYGLTYDWGKDVKFALDMQNSWVGNGATTSVAYLHSLIQL